VLRKLLQTKPSTKENDKTIIVVSGLPRSGTSMMMKMLAEGGVPVVTDSVRGADSDNPNGYFEFEPVKQLTEGRNQWLADAGGKVVKIISALLEHLPENHRYKIIFMEREIEEILASQKKMLSHRDEASRIGDTEMEKQFQQHLAATKYWLARQPNIDVLYVDYNKMISSPDNYCQTVADFIAIPVDISKMRSVPNERLYRNRAANP
jgi:hypothetical protein